jgi:hypothetical protein
MILLCGIPSESPLARVHRQLEERNAQVVLFNQRRFEQSSCDFAIEGGKVSGELRMGVDCFRLEEFTGVYTRLMDYRLLPELGQEPVDSPRWQQCRAIHEALTHWYEVAPGRVVNRTAPMGSNFSKPYQAQLIRRFGFSVPETLITNDPDCVVDFRKRHARVVYKSISGVRSIVQTLTEEDMKRVERVRWCPTQFQQCVEGIDVRVHVVGTEVYATAIRSEAMDYRYAQRQTGESADLEPVELTDEMNERCVRLAAGLGLPLVGIDLKVTPEEEVYCFEVNPSPAFSYFEANTGQPIADAIARYLMGGGAQAPRSTLQAPGSRLQAPGSPGRRCPKEPGAWSVELGALPFTAITTSGSRSRSGGCSTRKSRGA